MKANFKKILLFMLMISMIISIAGCGEKDTKTPAEEVVQTAKEAYRDLLQGIVDIYGIPDELKTARASADIYYTPDGLIDAEMIDISGDGEDELVCAYGAGDDVKLEIYEYENNEPVLKWQRNTTGRFIFGLNNKNGKIYWYYGPTFHHAEDLYTYRDGGYKHFGTDIADGDPDWESIEMLYHDSETRLMDISVWFGVYEDFDAHKVINKWKLDAPKAQISPLEALSGMKYFGDKSKCKMTKEMAQAYKDAIESEVAQLGKTADKYDDFDEVFAVLVDLSGDGMPILLTCHGKRHANDPTFGTVDLLGIWTWDGTRAEKNKYSSDMVRKSTKSDSGYENSDVALYIGFYAKPNSGMIVIQDSDSISVGDCECSVAYTVSNARMAAVSKFVECGAYNENGVYKGAKLLGVNAKPDEILPEYYESASLEELLAAGYEGEQDENGEYYSLYAHFVDGNLVTDDNSRLTAFSLVPQDAQELVIYEGSMIGDDIDREQWLESNKAQICLELYTKANKAEKVAVDIEHSNFSNGLKYLEEILKGLGGNIPDDASNTEISNYISKYISKKSETEISSEKNSIRITSDSISASVKAAIEAKDDMLKLCGKYDIALGKTPVCSVRIVCRDIGKGARAITFSSDILTSIEGCDELRIIIGDDRTYVVISAEDMKTLCNKYSSWSIELGNKNDIEYKINFKDDKGKTIEKIDAKLGFSVAGGGDLYTIERTTDGESMNWGGQPNSELGSTEFSTAYSGTYTIVKKDIEIKDIDSLSKEEQEKIEFIVARDIMSVKDGSFEPDKETSRYEFAKAFVRIFYNYDDSKPCSFSDVPKESEYYGYVASGEELKVIEGYPDGTFKGDNTVSMEEAIAFCSRILADYKKYSYPENTAEYLSFDDNSEISAWAEKEIALAVREGLIEKGGKLNPQAKINRQESAELLYKLYMLLHDSEATVAGDIKAESHTDGSNTLAIAIASSAAVLLMIVIIFVVLIKKKKKTDKAE